MSLNTDRDKTQKNPFNICKNLHSEIKEYKIIAETKEIANIKFENILNELKKKYGENFVVYHEQISGPIRDSKEKIVGYERIGKFVCFIPEKKIDKEEKNEEEIR